MTPEFRRYIQPDARLGQIAKLQPILERCGNVAINNPNPFENRAAPRSQPPKKQMSIWTALGILVAIGVGIYLISLIVSNVVVNLAYGVADNFGIPGLAVFLVLCAVGYFMLKRKK